jgi:hypothetical protein
MPDNSNEIHIARSRGLNIKHVAENLAKPGVLSPLSDLIDAQLGGFIENGQVGGNLQVNKMNIMKKFMSEIRLSDIGCVKYWMWMLLFVFIFMAIEIIIIFSSIMGSELWDLVKANGIDHKKFYFTMHVLKRFAYLSFFLLFFVVLFLVGLFFLNDIKKLIKRNIPLKLVPTATTFSILIIAMSILGLNFYLVMRSGWTTSPFLPGLLGIAGIIAGLPRENNFFTVSLSLICIGSGLFCITHSAPQLSLWVDNGLSSIINACSFAIAVIISILLRWIANTKIET